MNRLSVNAKSKKYDIVISNSFDNLLKEIIGLNLKISKIVIISDDKVAKYHMDDVVNSLKPHFTNVATYTFKNGEAQKHLGTISEMYDFMLENKLDRKSLVLALGGGVTGDMAGFTAATYMRGIPFIQIPTSLLSQVDSSVGGKTGVDFKGHKNIIGAFYQPELVYINTQTLKTLDKEEFYNGMGEVIKHGLIADSIYLNTLELEAEKILNLDDDATSKLIYTSCKIKSDVVSEDETEQGKRALLNFGHTAGHAIERLKDFKLAHGACVAIGMMVALNISQKLGYISQDEIFRVKNILDLYHLPTHVDGLIAEDIYNEMFYDKKTTHNQINFILLNSVGNAFIEKNLDKAMIIDAINSVIR